jgi:hypothetical protein
VSEHLKGTLALIHQMFRSADIDEAFLRANTLDTAWLKNFENQRVVNSFLFNYLKIQDKMGGKLFRQVLMHWRELDADTQTMLDVLNRLERLGIIESVEAWDKLREIRNTLTHEYPEEDERRLENIHLALRGYVELKAIVEKLEARL